MGLDNLDSKNILLHLSGKFNINQIENYLGNKILYPHVVPLTPTDKAIEVAIVKELMKADPNRFYESGNKRIYLYSDLLKLFTDINQLALSMLDIFRPKPMATLILKDEIAKDAGTYIRPEIINPKGQLIIELRLGHVVIGKSYQVKIGTLTSIPADYDKIDISFSSLDATLFSQNKVELEISGGVLGVIVDTRI